MEQSREADKLDYAILKAVSQADIPLWKKKLYDQLIEEKQIFPGFEEVSEQTVGRRVDKLVADNALETTIVSTEELEDIDRSHMIGYKLTEEGEQVMGEQRDRILRAKVVAAADPILTSDFNDIDISKEATLELLKDEFDIELDEELQEELLLEELIVLLANYYSNMNVRDIVTEDSIRRIAGLAEKNPGIHETLLAPSLAEEVRQYLAGTEGTPAKAKA